MTAPLCFGPYRLDVADAALWRDAERVALAPEGFDLLCLLAARAGQTIPKEELIAAVWPATHVGEGTLKVLVRELRVALGDDAARPQYIETVERRGYRFVAPTPTAVAVTAAPHGRGAELAALAAHLARAAAGVRQEAAVLQRVHGAQPQLAGELGMAGLTRELAARA